MTSCTTAGLNMTQVFLLLQCDKEDLEVLVLPLAISTADMFDLNNNKQEKHNNVRTETHHSTPETQQCVSEEQLQNQKLCTPYLSVWITPLSLTYGLCISRVDTASKESSPILQVSLHKAHFSHLIKYLVLHKSFQFS